MTDKKIQFIKEVPKNARFFLFPSFENETPSDKLGRWIADSMKNQFQGKLSEKKIWINEKGQHICLLGLGKRDQLQKSYRAFRSFAFHEGKDERDYYIVFAENSEDLTYQCGLGLGMADYNINFFKESNEPLKANFYIHDSKETDSLNESLQESLLTAETQKSIMRLVDYPSNHKTPKFLANWARRSASKYGFKVEAMEGDEVEKAGLHALWAVGKGSENPPCFIVMDYTPTNYTEDTHTLGLVGKGVTFDTGGISIKPHNNMHYMKSDMGGASAVFGAVELAAKLKLNIRVIGIVPAAENSVDERSFRPGDVIKSYSGKTIEVINTDAEGRLVLADGLAYLQKNFEVDTVIDLATLTGSCVRALGYHAAGLFTKNEELKDAITKAGENTDNRVWPLPLWDEYGPEMDSDVADIKNLGTSPLAGAITAAKFLEFFIPDHPRWAHIDIAGVAFGDSEFAKMKSSTGFGPRMLIELMKQLSKK